MALTLHLITSDFSSERYLQLTNPALSLEMHLFDKLEPVWNLCDSQGVEAHYFKDFLIEAALVKKIIQNKEPFLGEIFLRKPFGQEANEVALGFFSLLEEAQTSGRNILALCD